MMDQNSTAYIIPFGFASDDELMYSDAASMNSAICSGDKSATDMFQYCIDRTRDKHGILRRMCNSTRPTNTMRYKEFPGRPNITGPMYDQIGYMVLPDQYFDRSTFLFMNDDGRFESVKVQEPNVVMYSRFPTTGKGSVFAMKVRRIRQNERSMRVPLDMYKRNNSGFDDEAWMLKLGSKDAEQEALNEGARRGRTATSRVCTPRWSD